MISSFVIFDPQGAGALKEKSFALVNYRSFYMVAKIILIFIGTIICNSAFARISTVYTPAEYLKNYALSTCLAYGFSSKEVKEEAAAAARGYTEFGDLPLEAYTEAALTGKKFLDKKYIGQYGEKLTVMKCIDYYHSKELEMIIKKYSASKTPIK